MKKSGSVINVLSLYILMTTLLGHELFHIFRNEKIRPQNTSKIVEHYVLQLNEHNVLQLPR